MLSPSTLSASSRATRRLLLADGRHDAWCEEALHLRQDDVDCRAWSAHVPPYQRPQAQDHRCSRYRQRLDRLPRHPRAPKESFRNWWKKEKGQAPARDNAERVDIQALIEANKGKVAEAAANAKAAMDAQAAREAKENN